MSLIGRLHPLLVHFPIALVLTAGAAEIAAAVTRAGHRRAYWRAIGVANLRGGALMAVATVIAGLELASASFEEVASSLVWHRGAGVVATLTAIVTAIIAGRQTGRFLHAYRAMLLVTVVLMAITAHLGAALVWGWSFRWP
jgi:uncharacterized membrane protein